MSNLFLPRHDHLRHLQGVLPRKGMHAWFTNGLFERLLLPVIIISIDN